MFPDCYPQLNETQRMMRDAIRRVVERELKPHVPALERQEALPYPYVRKLIAALGMTGQGELSEAMALAAIQMSFVGIGVPAFQSPARITA